MPFTLAHPAIVLPFIKINKRYLSATGLVAGSVAPDFEYFLKMTVKDQHGHSIPGLFFVDIPVAIVIAILFQQVIKNNLIDNLPGFFQSRFHALRQIQFIAYLKSYPLAFLFAVALGASSHLLWDSFTHPGGFFVEHLSFYSTIVVPFDGVKYPLYYALQNVCTYAGMLIITLYIFYMKPDPATVIKRPALMYWVTVVIISLLIFAIRFMIKPETMTLGSEVVTSIAALCYAFLITGLIPFRRAVN